MTEQDRLDIQYLFDASTARPGPRVWARHILLLLLTFCTMTIAGVLPPFGISDKFIPGDPQTPLELFQFFGTLSTRHAFLMVETAYDIFTRPEYLAYGLKFSLSLIFILISHEMGHYIACRLYKVDATLPFFIPTPPLVGPAGTFGAFIKILSPLPSRRAAFDIGVAGPIAGFVALIPVALMGVASMEIRSPQQVAYSSGGIVFSDPLLIKLVAVFFGVDLHFGNVNAFYFAAWLGLLVTALNLIPSGQLDGGHAMYAVFGERVHFWTGRVAFAVMAAIAIIGGLFMNSYSGFLFAIVLAVMMRIRHPAPLDESPLDLKRKLVAVLTVLIFALSFTPFPIIIN